MTGSLERLLEPWSFLETPPCSEQERAVHSTEALPFIYTLIQKQLHCFCCGGLLHCFTHLQAVTQLQRVLKRRRNPPSPTPAKVKHLLKRSTALLLRHTSPFCHFCAQNGCLCIQVTWLLQQCVCFQKGFGELCGCPDDNGYLGGKQNLRQNHKSLKKGL